MERYALLLDLFPLADEIAMENPLLAGALQAVSLELLCRNKSQTEQIEVLLMLARDLGYISVHVADFLLARIRT